MTEFQEVKIVGADEGLTHAPALTKPAMYDVYLKLSHDPPYQWSQLFDHEWSMRLYSMKRRARIENDYIVIHCALEEIERYHLPELREVLQRTNDQYRQVLTQQARQDQQETARRTAADQQKRDALGRLKFD